MEGAALAAKEQLNIALYTAWHTARFALNGFNDKGRLAGNKTLADLLNSEPSERPEKLENAKLIAGFHSLQARGFDVQISRNEIN